MGWFDEQIRERKRQDNERFADAIDEISFLITRKRTNFSRETGEAARQENITKAIGQVKAATEALRDAVSELKEVIGEIKKENRRDHEDFSKRLNRAENRLTKLETEFEGQRRE
jgi:hypothetical protein